MQIIFESRDCNDRQMRNTSVEIGSFVYRHRAMQVARAEVQSSNAQGSRSDLIRRYRPELNSNFAGTFPIAIVAWYPCMALDRSLGHITRVLTRKLRHNQKYAAGKFGRHIPNLA
jgi:hypothetical protein